MKYFCMVTTTNAGEIGMPPQALMEAIDQLGKEAGRKMIEGGMVANTGLGRVRGGKLTLDGPYTESKEVVAGYALYELDSEAEAVEWTRKFLELHRVHWPVWEGECKIFGLMPG